MFLTEEEEKQKNKQETYHVVKKKKQSLFIKIIKIMLKIFLILFILFLIIGGFCAYKLYEIIKDVEISKEDLVIKYENTEIKDLNGNLLGVLNGNENRVNITLNDMPDYLVDAFISIEDERFYEHKGVDIKRTLGATYTYIKNKGHSPFGGSTITQQLVKNLTGDTTDSITRKIKEWWKSWQLETCLSKDEILEAYLNIIYVGPNMYGVETASKYYFNKSSKDLTLDECAFLAGMNNSPNSYNPFGENKNTERITKRTKTVLTKMLELNYIDEDIYNKAINNVDNGLKFKKGKIESESAVYSYHTDELISEITKDISKKYHISETFATNYINMAGLNIHSTQNSNIQNITETEFKKSKYSIPSKNGGNSSQAAMVVIDHQTGYVLSCVRWIRRKN